MLFRLLIMLSIFSVNVVFASVVPISPTTAIQNLIEGNKRYMQGKMLHPNLTAERRAAIHSKQTPFAVVVGCSDSRVIPEMMFDQGLGDLFVVRVAGNVVGPIGLASILYGVEVLHAPLIIVVGHEGCGAVKAVTTHSAQDIEPIAVKVEAAIQQFSHANESGLEGAVKANVRGVVAQLRSVPQLVPLLEKHRLAIIGGYYHLQSGEVELCCNVETTTPAGAL